MSILNGEKITVVFVMPSKKIDTPQVMSFVKLLVIGLTNLGLQIHVFKSVKSINILNFFRQGSEIKKLIRDVNPDIVVAQYGTYAGLLVAFFGRRPRIITYRGADLNPEPHTNGLLSAMQHLASHIASLFADGIVCVSQELAEKLIVNVRCEIIPSPTDIVLFQPKDQRECRKMLGWEEDKHIAVFFGGNNPKLKEIGLAYEVKEELVRRKSFLELRILELEIPITQMPVYLNSADCLLFLSRYEGSPNIIRDACACNLPVVTTPVGDVKIVLRDIVPKYIVPRNVNDLADALEEVCRFRPRSNGREHIMKYSTEVISQRTYDFYKEVIDHCKK
jgi:teichuronic acid biosynthesis glycosyltransferase TuaC